VVLTAAVLEKRAGLKLANQDLYVSVVGGLKVVEPAVDLGVAMAVASNFRNIPMDAGTVVMGEIGLTGEVRAVGQVEQRIREAVRLGFRRFIVPERNLDVQERYPDLELIGVKTVREALDKSL
jgi:DNA repair protein RadA/Sms